MNYTMKKIPNLNYDEQNNTRRILNDQNYTKEKTLGIK